MSARKSIRYSVDISKLQFAENTEILLQTVDVSRRLNWKKTPRGAIVPLREVFVSERWLQV